MRHVLVTGFEPFGGDSQNPSADIACALDGREIAGRPIRGAVLPCVFGVSLVALRRLLEETNPVAVLCLGVAANRREITPERLAINLDDARIPDNAGAQPADRPIIPGAPAGLWSTLPVKAIVAALHARGLPAKVSESAGTFVCNHVFYGLLHELRDSPDTPTGFIHIPFPRSDLPLDALVTAITIAIETTLCEETRPSQR